jgi:hypothetical protein
MNESRVFLADDHAVVRVGLRALMNAETGIIVVGEADDGLDCMPGRAGIMPPCSGDGCVLAWLVWL